MIRWHCFGNRLESLFKSPCCSVWDFGGAKPKKTKRSGGHRCDHSQRCRKVIISYDQKHEPRAIYGSLSCLPGDVWCWLSEPDCSGHLASSYGPHGSPKSWAPKLLYNIRCKTKLAEIILLMAVHWSILHHSKRVQNHPVVRFTRPGEKRPSIRWMAADCRKLEQIANESFPLVVARGPKRTGKPGGFPTSLYIAICVDSVVFDTYCPTN